MGRVILGLDVGCGSVGWAIVPQAGEGSADRAGILGGVRVFPEGVNRTPAGREESRGAQRREKRGARRVHQRRRHRREKLTGILQEAGLLPKDSPDLTNLLATDPYPIRKKGLDESLTLQEFGRVLFHLNQRRGFKSNRKKEKSKDDGKVAQATAALQEEIEASGSRTLGEYLARISEATCHADVESEKVRNHYTLRAMYRAEFDALWEAQRRFHPDVLTDALRDRAADAIFHQRPLRFDPEVIGDCELEPGEKRCARAHWLGQQFRLLQEVNLLRFLDAETGEERPLSEPERKGLIEALIVRQKLTFDRIRALLGFLETSLFNLEYASKRKYLSGNVVEASLRRALGKWYASAAPEQRETINDALADVEDDDALRELALAEWGLTEAQAEKLLQISLPIGYFRVSLKATRKIIPHLEAGCVYSEAKERAGYDLTPETELSDLLPPVDGAIPHLTNPMVHRSLTEARKVVNAIVRRYGRPDEIVVELARDVKNSRAKRERISRENSERRRENESIRERLMTDFALTSPSRDDIIKYRLWMECGQVCPYTGRPIPAGALFTPEIQVEHILPYPRSLDDSYMNKTLCFQDENRRKANQTPYEAYHQDEARYEAVCQRARCLVWPKRRRFHQKAIDLDECIQRQLNDTRYVSRVIVGYLRRLGCTVRCSKGGLTAELRRQWGLNGLLDPASPNVKTHDDHRHHAVDAVVIALTTRSALHRLSSVKGAAQRPEFPAPWEGFRQDVRDAVNAIHVSHRPDRKLSGPLHEETGLGAAGEPRAYVHRVPVDRLTPAQVGKIRDPRIRQIVRQRCREHGIGEKGSKAIGKILTDPPLRMPSGVPIRRVRIVTTEKTAVPVAFDGGRPFRFVVTGGNHHVEIYETTDAKGHPVWTGRAVSRWKTHALLRAALPVVNRKPNDGSAFVMSLCINDMVLLTDPETGRAQLYRVQKMSVDQPTSRPDLQFRLHTAARIDDDTTGRRVQSWKNLRELRPRKVTVGPLGDIQPCND